MRIRGRRLLGHEHHASRDHVVRGYFGCGEHEHVVRATGTTAGFVLHVRARNVETSRGGVTISTPPSRLRTSGSAEPRDGLVPDVPAQTGMSLNAIGARVGETVDVSSAFGARVTVFLTVVTCQGAKVGVTSGARWGTRQGATRRRPMSAARPRRA